MKLDGITVVDLTQLLPGPYATQQLVDMGADVIKIEDTASGDAARHMKPFTERKVGAIFDSVNRGKQSVAIDLKSEQGRKAFYTLVENADVVVEQFRPGVVDRLKIDYKTLCKYNDELVYCSLSGYGQTGPYADRVGHDLNFVGVAGLVDMTRDGTDMNPQIPGYLIGDLGGGLFAAFAVVSALFSREFGNTRGEYIDIAMADIVLSFSQSVAYQAAIGEDPRPGETALTGNLPWYGIYECADKRYITIAALEPKFWEVFCKEVNKKELINMHGSNDPAVRRAVRDELEKLFARKPLEQWMSNLSAETMTGPVNTPTEAINHPQIKARHIVKRPTDAPPRVGFPALSSDKMDQTSEEIPDHGEHTDKVLLEAGISPERIAVFYDADVIK